MIPYSGKFFHLSSPYEDDRMFLQIVSYAGYVRRGFDAVREPYPRDLTERGVGLFGGGGVNPYADASFLRTHRERRRRRFVRGLAPSLPYQLIDCRHSLSISPRLYRPNSTTLTTSLQPV